MKKIYPTLYKKTNAGTIQYWSVWVILVKDEWRVCVEYGQLGTDKPQTTYDVVKKGKNLGRSNSTTTKEQAYVEARAKWDKQKKQGYVETLSKAEKGQVDKIIRGGVLPMLAVTYDDSRPHKIEFPCFVQPKIDGHRCVAILKNGKCTLWSRSRKEITGVPHIARELEKQFQNKTLVFDGDLYNHDYRNKFEELTHFIRQKKPIKGHEVVEYHIYDMVSKKTFSERNRNLKRLLQNGVSYVKVTTSKVFDPKEIAYHLNQKLRKGYEGIMIRNASSLYQHKRTTDLQKLKPMKEAEYKIVGSEEGKGRLRGHVGAFLCEMENGKQFRVKMSGSHENLKKYFVKPSIWKGKMLTVQYQDLTGKNGVPRFPVGLRIRDDL